jgi:hypothetical protein
VHGTQGRGHHWVAHPDLVPVAKEVFDRLKAAAFAWLSFLIGICAAMPPMAKAPRRSQNEDAAYRALRKLDKIRLRLGDQRSPQRPKGMWQRTYEKLCHQLDEAEGRAEETFFLGWRRRKSPS